MGESRRPNDRELSEALSRTVAPRASLHMSLCFALTVCTVVDMFSVGGPQDTERVGYLTLKLDQRRWEECRKPRGPGVQQ